MPLRLRRYLDGRIKSWNLPLIIQLWIFILVFLFFQILWESFENEWNQFFIFTVISRAIGDVLLSWTPAFLNSLFSLGIERDGISLILPGGFYVNYLFHLSGIKQICLVIILFFLAPGPWKKKCWYIPFSVFLLLVTTWIRFMMLTIHCMIFPHHIFFIQEVLFGPLLYFEILMLWMAWVLLVARTATLKTYRSGWRDR